MEHCGRGLVLGAAISQWGKVDGVVEFAFLVAVPALASAGMLFWLGELARISRLADYLCAVEAKVDLALQHPDGEEEGKWFESFSNRWTASRETSGGASDSYAPAIGDAALIGPEPIGFERWLRELRSKRAGKNLAWVYFFRLLLFPVVMAGSLAVGAYYSFFQSAEPHAHWETIVAMGIGVLILASSTWLAVEIVITFRTQGATPTVNRGRRILRRSLGRWLEMDEWQDS